MGLYLPNGICAEILNGELLCKRVMRAKLAGSLTEASVVRTEQIGVSVRNGVVQLDGHVGSLYEKWAAECAALRVTNVKSVASEIIVDLLLEAALMSLKNEK